MAYIPLLDSAVRKELNAMTVNKKADHEKITALLPCADKTVI